MRKLDEYIKWHSLEGAAKRLSLIFEEEVSIKDVLKLCIDDYLNLSVILRDQQATERLEYCPLANSFEYIYEAASHHVIKDLRCLNAFGNDYLAAFDALDEENSKLLLPEMLLHGNELPDQGRMYAIKTLASQFFHRHKEHPEWHVYSLPEVVYGNGYSSLRTSPCLVVLNGVFELHVDKIKRQEILDRMIVGDSLRMAENEIFEWSIFDINGDKYTPVSGTIDDPPNIFLKGISCIDFEKGLPPVEILVIQTKHLIEFENGIRKLTVNKQPDLKNEGLKLSHKDLFTSPPQTIGLIYSDSRDAVDDFLEDYDRHPSFDELYRKMKAGDKNLDRDNLRKNYNRWTKPMSKQDN